MGILKPYPASKTCSLTVALPDPKRVVNGPGSSATVRERVILNLGIASGLLRLMFTATGAIKNLFNLFCSLGCKRFDYGYVLQQFPRQAMPLLQIYRAVIGNPDFSLVIFRDQNFKREVDG
jgi:hypothetical protein